MLFPDGENNTIYGLHLCLIDLTWYEGDQRLKPGLPAFFFHVVLDGQGNYPLASSSIIDIFPLGSNSFLEKHIICVGHYLLHLVNVVIHSPEVLDCAEAVNLVQDILVMSSFLALLLLFIMTEGIDVPKCPAIESRKNTSNHCSKGNTNTYWSCNSCLACPSFSSGFTGATIGCGIWAYSLFVSASLVCLSSSCFVSIAFLVSSYV